MITATEPTNVQIADVLEKAAAHLERVGLNKGYLYDEDKADEGTPLVDCPVCAWGAIYYAVHGAPRPSSIGTDADFQLTEAAGLAVITHLHAQTLVNWSDARGRQKRQVTKAFRDTAAGLRAGVSA